MYKIIAFSNQEFKNDIILPPPFFDEKNIPLKVKNSRSYKKFNARLRKIERISKNKLLLGAVFSAGVTGIVLTAMGIIPLTVYVLSFIGLPLIISNIFSLILYSHYRYNLHKELARNTRNK